MSRLCSRHLCLRKENTLGRQNFKLRDYLGDLDIDGGINLKVDVKESRYVLGAVGLESVADFCEHGNGP
jgi:hypothetical protein